MKVLLATDGTPCSQPAIDEACRRDWPPGSEVLVVTVVHAPLGGVVDPLFLVPSFHETMIVEDRERAPGRLEGAARQIRQARPGVEVHTRILEGQIDDEIAGEAGRWGADLILMGSHHHGTLGRLLHHSAARGVVAKAACSVEVVRCNHEHDAPVEPDAATQSTG